MAEEKGLFEQSPVSTLAKQKTKNQERQILRKNLIPRGFTNNKNVEKKI